MIRHRNGKQHPTNFPPKGDLTGLLISSSILSGMSVLSIAFNKASPFTASLLLAARFFAKALAQSFAFKISVGSEFSVVCKISVFFEIPIVVFEKFILKMSITKGSVPHLIALQIYALISAKASKTKDKLIINISSLCVFSLNFFSRTRFLCVFIFILFYSILYTKIAYIFCIQLHLN